MTKRKPGMLRWGPICRASGVRTVPDWPANTDGATTPLTTSTQPHSRTVVATLAAAVPHTSEPAPGSRGRTTLAH